MPLPALPCSDDQTTEVCAVAAVDTRGRVSDRSVVQALGWREDQRLEMRAVPGSVVVRASDNGLFTLTSQGYLRLPAAARHWCALVPGERVLLASDRRQDAVIIHTMSTVWALVAEYHAALLGGATS